MTHELWHVICGGAGNLLGDINIKIRDHDVLNVAVALKPEQIPPKDFEKLKKRIAKDVHKWYDEARKLGLDVSYYQPHHENFPDHPPEAVE